MHIISKFAVASETGLETLFFLKKTKLKDMYETVVPAQEFALFLEQQLQYRTTVDELNDWGTQLLVVYADEVPAGFAMANQSNHFPEVLQGKKNLHFSYFYILPEYDTTEIRTSLWHKCLSISTRYEAIWLELLQNDPLLPFLESSGCILHETSRMKPFSLPSHILIRFSDAL